MSNDIVARMRDFAGWKFQVPECGHHQNAGNTKAPIFVPEHISDTGEWIPVLIETGYSEGFRYYMFSPEFMLRQAADEIERLRALLRGPDDLVARLRELEKDLHTEDGLYDNYYIPVIGEAADEIERLREIMSRLGAQR